MMVGSGASGWIMGGDRSGSLLGGISGAGGGGARRGSRRLGGWLVGSFLTALASTTRAVDEDAVEAGASA